MMASIADRVAAPDALARVKTVAATLSGCCGAMQSAKPFASLAQIMGVVRRGSGRPSLVLPAGRAREDGAI